MLTFYGAGHKGAIAEGEGRGVPEAVNWIDAFDPSEAERIVLKDAMGARVPALADLQEIESSSRLSSEGSTLIMSLPATIRDDAGYPRSTPVGFVLNRDRLTTIRYAHLPSFESLARQLVDKRELSEGGLGAMLNILEAIVDQLADVLERVGIDLDGMSRQVFAVSIAAGKTRPRRANDELSDMLKKIGGNGDLISKVSESLLGLSRMVPFLGSKLGTVATPDFKTRLDTLTHDAQSLREYEEHLSGKTQFLLDTLLGLANIQQNNVFRILTVVSVVGIPPTFFASMYGMNFKNMPEYDWHYGYEYGLTLIFLSGLIPAVWFKVKGWW